MRPQPLINSHDVPASSRFYQALLGAVSDHGGEEYERLNDRDGRLVLQIHHFDVAHDHGHMGDPKAAVGNGVLLWFEVDDFDAAVARARALEAPILLEPHTNPPDGDGGPNHREIWLRDPTGYTVVLSSPDGEANPNGWQPPKR